MATKTNPFNNLKPKTKKATIKALGDAEIEYRELTLDENATLREELISGYNAETGEPELDYTKAMGTKYSKVALMLVNPAMSREDLMALSGEAEAAIDEILALSLDNAKQIDPEGN